MDADSYWKAFDRRRRSHQRYGELRIARGLQEQIEQIIESLPETGAPAMLAGLDQFFKADPLQRAYEDLYGRVGSDFANRTLRSLQKSLKQEETTDQWVSELRSFVRFEAGNRITEVSRVTRYRIRIVLQRGIEQGLGIEEIARNMQQSNAVNRIRARVIARTEIISASNKGSDIGARSTGLNLNKEWIATPDSRTRPDHIDIDGQIVGMDERFIVGGEEAKYPGDLSLSAEQAINCRCTQGYIPQ